MGILEVSAILLTFTALFLFLNGAFLKLPNTVGLMALALGSAALLALLQFLGFGFVGTFASTIINSIDLNEAVINGFLCLLLFVGALHVDLEGLWKERVGVSTLATLGVLISTFLTGFGLYVLAWMIGINLPLLYCLVFGALIAPTDAVTVLSFLKGTRLPQALESKITGESLLNDGMSIVLFTSLFGFAVGNQEVSLLTLPLAVTWDIAIAIAVGLVGGFIAHLFITKAKHENPYIAIVTTLALATGSYAAAGALGASGPIAVVVAGLFVGNQGEVFAENAETIYNLSNFWELIDEILNAILFVIVGLELLAISTMYLHLALGVMMIPMVLISRYVSIKAMLHAFYRGRNLPNRVGRILTWGGLRGGISIALVLSLPAGETREILMTATYFVVIFSVFVQGPTLKYLVGESSH